MGKPLLITARLSSPLAGDAPALDALMESLLSIHHGKENIGCEPGYKIDRQFPAPPQGGVPIPIGREWLGPWLVGRCSAPILSVPTTETVEYVGKKIEVDLAGLLATDQRRVINTGNSWTKSYRLPLRLRTVDRVAWFAAGDRRTVLKLLRRCGAIGKKISIGYGRVEEWDVEAIDDDLSWFAPSREGLVLMRPLPIGPWLPSGVIGCRRDFGACSAPYWHPDRYTEILMPC